MQAWNEFPLFLISASYALYYHVDSLYLLNDGSDDFSKKTFEDLKSIWGSRIQIINTKKSHFYKKKK